VKAHRRLVLVEDHWVFRSGVRSELDASIEVVGEAGSVSDAIPLIRDLDPDVVLLDVHLPDGNGAAVIGAVAPDRPGVKFLALSVSDAAEDVIAVIRAGARGYVTKSISGDESTTQCTGLPTAMPSSHRGSRASSSTPSGRVRPRATPSSTS